MEVNLKMDAQTFQLVFAALGELPAKVSRMVMNNFQAQVEAQEQQLRIEAMAKAAATATHPAEPAEGQATKVE